MESGLLLQRDGSPAAGVRVALYELTDQGQIQNAAFLASAITRADGSWALPGVDVPDGTLVEGRAVVNGSPVIYDIEVGGPAAGAAGVVLQEGVGEVSQGQHGAAAGQAAPSSTATIDDSGAVAGFGDVEADQVATGPSDAPGMGLLGALPSSVGVEASASPCGSNYAFYAETSTRSPSCL